MLGAGGRGEWAAIRVSTALSLVALLAGGQRLRRLA